MSTNLPAKSGDRRPKGDDLFEKSTMTFGEHLDELRGALVRSLIAIGLTFLIGLSCAKWIVRFIESPLTGALERYYADRDLERLRLDFNIKKDSEEHRELKAFREFMLRNNMAYEQVYLEEQEARRIVEFAGLAPPRAAEMTTTGADAGAGDRPEGGATAPNGSATPSPQDVEAASDESAGGTGDPSADSGEDADLHRPALPTDPPKFLLRLWRPANSELVTLNPQESFLIWVKAGFVGGLLLASPYVFYELWNFIAAGLYPHERRYVHIYLPISIGLFLSGAALAFFVVFRYVLDFLFQFNQGLGLQAQPRISEWMSFVMVMPIGFGIAFQLPLVMLLLYRIKILTLEMYVSKWRIAVLAISVISMILTPADPVSMIAMAVPLCLLYFLGIAFCKWMPRTRSPFGEGYDPR